MCKLTMFSVPATVLSQMSLVSWTCMFTVVISVKWGMLESVTFKKKWLDWSLWFSYTITEPTRILNAKIVCIWLLIAVLPAGCAQIQ